MILPFSSFQMGFSDGDGKAASFAEQYTIRRESHLSSLHQKEEEMRQRFVIRVKEKEAELKEAEREGRAIFSRILFMRNNIYSISK